MPFFSTRLGNAAAVRRPFDIVCGRRRASVPGVTAAELPQFRPPFLSYDQILFPLPTNLFLLAREEIPRHRLPFPVGGLLDASGTFSTFFLPLARAISLGLLLRPPRQS